MDTTTNGAALAIVPTGTAPSASTQLEPSTAEQAMWLASQLVKSGVLGKSVTKPEAAFAIILAGRELGLTAMQSLRSCHVIEGKVVLSSDLMAALVLRSPTCRYFQMVESTNDVARYETLRVGAAKPTVMSFTMEDAKLAGVTGKQNWRTYPAAMLRARCIAALARVVYPDLLMGIYEQDEIPPSNAMQSARDAGPIAEEPTPIAAVVVRPTAPPAADSIATYWTSRMDAAESIEDLDVIAAEAKAELTEGPTRTAVGKAYVANKQRLGGAK